jgi:DNA primase catalytic subunit
MSNYLMPKGMRPTTLQERKEFYTQEFNLQKAVDWFLGKPGKVKFAVIIGRHSKIFPPEYADDMETTIIIEDYRDLEDLRGQIVEFLPEATYYDRNVYAEKDKVVGQELAFDLDPENVVCPIHGGLAEKMKRHQGLGFCELELDMVRGQTLCLYEELQRQFGQLQVVYSGRGFHIHVFDREAYTLTTKERSALAARVKAKGFAIDAWVTEGESRLIRLPYGLNGLVSRVCLPLEKNEVEKFNPIIDARCIPKFLH